MRLLKFSKLPRDLDTLGYLGFEAAHLAGRSRVREPASLVCQGATSLGAKVAMTSWNAVGSLGAKVTILPVNLPGGLPWN